MCKHQHIRYEISEDDGVYCANCGQHVGTVCYKCDGDGCTFYFDDPEDIESPVECIECKGVGYFMEEKHGAILTVNGEGRQTGEGRTMG